MKRVYMRQVFGEGNIEWDGYDVSPTGHTIHQEDKYSTFTGIFDARGHKIMAVTTENPIGFGCRYED